MTKEITKAFILQQIQDKFRLRDLVAETFRFSEEVVPIYNIEQHLLKAEILTETDSITGGPTSYIFFTVPQNEKWSLHRYNVVFVTGSYTVAGVMITRPGLSNYIYTDLAAAQSVSYAHDLPKDIELYPGDSIRIYVDGYTSTGNLSLIVDVTKEETR